MMVAGRHSNDCDCKDSRRFQTDERSTHATRFRKSLRTQAVYLSFRGLRASRQMCKFSRQSSSAPSLPLETNHFGRLQ